MPYPSRPEVTFPILILGGDWRSYPSRPEVSLPILILGGDWRSYPSRPEVTFPILILGGDWRSYPSRPEVTFPILILGGDWRSLPLGPDVLGSILLFLLVAFLQKSTGALFFLELSPLAADQLPSLTDLFVGETVYDVRTRVKYVQKEHTQCD
jgi:hypothetical protein